jgi:hypothetical protein
MHAAHLHFPAVGLGAAMKDLHVVVTDGAVLSVQPAIPQQDASLQRCLNYFLLNPSNSNPDESKQQPDDKQILFNIHYK